MPHLNNTMKMQLFNGVLVNLESHRRFVSKMGACDTFITADLVDNNKFIAIAGVGCLSVVGGNDRCCREVATLCKYILFTFYLFMEI